jgi:hypothetical protein
MLKARHECHWFRFANSRPHTRQVQSARVFVDADRPIVAGAGVVGFISLLGRAAARSRLSVEGFDALAVLPHEPLCEERTVFSLPRRGQTKEVADHLAPAAGGATPAGPSRPVGDVDVVVARDFGARRDLASRHQIRHAFFKHLIGVWVATVIQVTIREAVQNDLPFGVIAVVRAFAKVLPNRRLRGDLSNDVDASDPNTCAE